MESLLRPYIARFKDYLKPPPKHNLKVYHPTFLPESFISTFHNQHKCHSFLIHLHKDNYIKQFQNIKKRIELNKCKSLSEFKGFTVQYEGSKTILYIYYELEKFTFREIMDSYYTKEEGFWRIFFPLTRALAFLEKNKLPHRNLNYYNIVMNENNEIKLLYNIGQPTSIDLYEEDSDSSDWEYLFLSPQEMVSKSNDDVQNPYRSDMFNLGAIFLTQLIDTEQGVYGDENYLRKKVASLKIKYSYSLCNILCRMLELDWEDRPDWCQLSLLLDEIQNSVEGGELKSSRLYTDVAPRMTRDLLSMVDLKQTRRTQISQFI